MKAILFFLLISFSAVGQILTPVDSIDEVELMPYQLSFIADTTNQLMFEQVSAPSFASKFTLQKDYQNKDFLTNINYWVRLPIRHTTSTDKVWLIEFYDQTIDVIEAHIPFDNGWC